MTLEEAKKLMTPEARDKLHKLISKPDEIDISKKVGNDIIMGAFCKAVMEGVIQQRSISQKMLKLLNSDTNTMSDIKLNEILETVHKNQPDVVCKVSLRDNKNDDMVRWYLYGNTSFKPIFEYVINRLGVTPQIVRDKLSNTLKTTIVNNMSQLVSKFNSLTEAEKTEFRVSIMSITRIVNMMDHIIVAEFINGYEAGDSTVEILFDRKY